MNSWWRGKSYNKIKHLELDWINKSKRERWIQKESCQPPSFIFPRKHNWRNGRPPPIPRLWNNFEPRIRVDAFLEASFFCVPFSVPALIFEPIKLRQERSFTECRSEEKKQQQSLGKYWNRQITSKLNQTCLMSGRYCISHWGISNQPNKMSLVCFFSS